jgi:hypothetical protein
MKRHRLPFLTGAAWLFFTGGKALSQREVGRQFVAPAPPEAVTICLAKKIITRERRNPEATAVAVARGVIY